MFSSSHVHSKNSTSTRVKLIKLGMYLLDDISSSLMYLILHRSIATLHPQGLTLSNLVCGYTIKLAF